MSLIELAEACERHARVHFALAARQTNDHSHVDLYNIDKGLACLERAAALRSRAANTGSTDKPEVGG